MLTSRILLFYFYSFDQIDGHPSAKSNLGDVISTGYVSDVVQTNFNDRIYQSKEIREWQMAKEDNGRVSLT
jgi:hypothetical protein